MQYRIAVFDDEVTGLQKTEEMIQRYAEEHTEHELEISCFTETEAFTEAVCDGLKDWASAFQILIIDISPRDGAGMESAKSLRLEGFEDVIIFMSPTSECCFIWLAIIAAVIIVVVIVILRRKKETEKA